MKSLGVFLVLSVLGSVLVGFAASSSVQAARSAPYELAWEFELPGLNLSSSPVIADIDSDGRNEIVFGHRDGKLRAYESDGSLKWEASAVPGPSQELCWPQSTPSAIDSSPAVADIDNDGVVEVVVGVGSASLEARGQNGSVIAFDGRTGTIEWSFNQSRDTGNIWDGQTPELDGWCEATFATPAIGDVNGDGAVDIVFGSYDFYIWAIDGHGNPLAGFPINSDDTVWSSPALFDSDDDGDVEIFIGGDSTPGGYVDHLGGIFRAIDYQDGKPVTMWTRRANDVFHSSPAIGDINGDGRFEAVTGTGDNWHIVCNQRASELCGPNDGSDHSKVWAFHLDDGTNVAGWPVSAADTVWSSPSLGDLDGDGLPEVVAGSDDKKVYAWRGDGKELWSVTPRFAHLGDGDIVRGSAVIADLDGDEDQDVAIGTAGGLALLDGSTGAELEADVFWRGRMSFASSHKTSPAVGELNGERYLVYVANQSNLTRTRVAAYKLPPTGSSDTWPMFRHGPTRVGTASISRAGHSAQNAMAGATPFFAEPLQWMVGTNIIDAGSGACIAPNTPATRGETALYLWRTQGRPDARPHPFSDVSGDELNRAVAWMYDRGITTGKSGTSFAPGDRLTRAEVAAFLYRLRGSPEAAGHPFTDLTAPWQRAAVAWLYASGITTGTTATTFAPNLSVRRGELATFLYRYVERPSVEFDPTSNDCSPTPTSDSLDSSNWIAVAVGRKHTCGLQAGGAIRCWGDNRFGQTDAPEGQFKAISAGKEYTCGLQAGGAIQCWGDNRFGQTDAPEGQFIAISAGPDSACGLRIDSSVQCWGSNSHGKSDAPGGEFLAVSVGEFHTCGLLLDSTLKCWGFSSRSNPSGRFEAVSVGDRRACGLRPDRTVECWGNVSRAGQGNVPQGEFIEVSSGKWYSCAVRVDGAVVCWGTNTHGQLDAPLGQFESVTTSYFHTCAISTTIECWGDTSY